jgi:flagellar protein FliS
MTNNPYAQNTHARYLEAEVLSADPLKLVSMLYRGALEAVGAARKHLAAGAIQERSRQITKAWEIVQELARSLDHSQGGDLSQHLAELYAYIQQRLLDANTQQADAPLAEAHALLATLAEAWQGIRAAQPAATQAPSSAYEPVSCSV